MVLNKKPMVSVILVLAIVFQLAPGLATGPVGTTAHNSSPGAFEGEGTETSPYLIQSAQDLALMATLVNNNIGSYNTTTTHYKLINNISLAAYNWIPIGNPFKSVFDGNMHEIHRLTIYNPGIANIGLFGSIDSKAVVKNLMLVHTDVYSASSNHQYVGGIAGYNNGTIENSSQHGYVTALATGMGYSNAGGIAGFNNGLIEKCYNIGTISAYSLHFLSRSVAGGIAGERGVGNDRVRNCYNAGEIYLYFRWWSDLGGIVGKVHTITNCYNVGNVHSTIGSGSPSNLKEGAIAGRISVSASGCYYLNNLAAGTGDGDVPGVYRKSLFEMQDKSTFTGFDFQNVWMIEPANGYPYPQLRSNPHVIPPPPISGNIPQAVSNQRKYDNHPQSLVSDPVDTATGAQVIDVDLLKVNGLLPLVFKASYNSLLLDEGPMGKGWGHNFETCLEELPEDKILVHWSAHRSNEFEYLGNNEYGSRDTASIYDRLIKNETGDYTLTRKDRTVYIFNPEGRMVEQKNRHGQALIMTYNPIGQLVQVKEPVSQKAIDISYNVDGLIEKVSDLLGREITLTYDDNRCLVVIQQPLGFTAYTYNEAGQILTATDSEGTTILTNIYDSLGRVASQDDAVDDNQLTLFSYDELTERGKLITTVTDRNGEQTVYVHDSFYRVLSITCALGNTTEYTYDVNGNRTSSTNVLGQTTLYGYDLRGNLISITDPAGGITRMTYDERDNLLSLENPAGKTVLYSYNASNNLIGITDPLENVRTYTYDGNGLLLSETLTGMGTTSYTYHLGLLQSKTEPTGVTTQYSYDQIGRLVGITDGDGHTTVMEYDDDGNITGITDPLGNKSSFVFNMYGEMLSQTDPKGNTTSYSYDGNGNRIRTNDALGNETRSEYDGEDRLIRVTDARNNTTTYIYDAAGRLVKITDPLGNTTSFEYDALGNLVKELDSYGVAVSIIEYDVLQNPVTLTDALGNVTTNVYDTLSRLTAKADPLGRVTHFHYDDLDRLISSIDALGQHACQEFSAAGQRIELTDPNGNRTGFSYDPGGRLTAEAMPSSHSITYNYNARDLVESIINGRGQSASFQYNNSGRLSILTDSTGQVSYAYDANGNILTVTDENGTITREYDALDRITSYTDTRGNTIGYEYDQVGNLVTLTYPNGYQIHYEYDAANRLISVTDWAERQTTYSYDRNGRLLLITRPNGTYVENQYDPAGRLLHSVDRNNEDELINQYEYTYDAAGNITTEVSEFSSAPPLVSVQMTYTTGNRLATFNGQQVIYDEDGNMTRGPFRVALRGDGSVDMHNLAYDSRNRLVSAAGLEYIYDAENHRISILKNGQQTNFVVNSNSILSQVLVKTEPSGAETYYVYGISLIGQENSDGTYQSYHYDLRGSTTALTANNGQITDRYSYSPFGQLIVNNRTTDTPFLYNGQFGVMTDENGLYHMRGRYYNPDIRRFINQDIILGTIINGQTLNRYAYALNNPVIFIDPDGEVPWLIAAAAGAAWGLGIQVATDWAKGEWSGWQEYAGSILGGAVTVGITVLTGNPYAGAAAGTTIKQSVTLGAYMFTDKERYWQHNEKVLLQWPIDFIVGLNQKVELGVALFSPLKVKAPSTLDELYPKAGKGGGFSGMGGKGGGGRKSGGRGF